VKYLKSHVKPDFKLALLAIGLSFFGLVMISSASSVLAYEKFKQAGDYYYVWRQGLNVLLGIVAMLFFSNFDYRRYRALAMPLLAGTTVLLIMVFIPHIGSEIKGAHRWLNLGFSFQPSELAKITFLIYICAWLESRKERLEGIWSGLLPFILMLGLISLLIILEPDLGTLTIIILSSIAVFFASGAPVWHFGSLGAFLAVIFSIFIASRSYRWNRLMTFLKPSAETLGTGYHVNQAFIAVSQGGLWGLGFGKSIQKLKYLPEPHTDSIFAIVCEELGFFRAALVILAFFYLFYLGLKIARRAPDTFGRLLALGLTCTLTIQAFVNIAAMLGLLPLTGVTLPFVSYGGSSLVISFIQVGILLNISRSINETN